jgi:hypothetical protein
MNRKQRCAAEAQKLPVLQVRERGMAIYRPRLTPCS